jgi:hypothetical protein
MHAAIVPNVGERTCCAQAEGLCCAVNVCCTPTEVAVKPGATVAEVKSAADAAVSDLHSIIGSKRRRRRDAERWWATVAGG